MPKHITRFENTYSHEVLIRELEPYKASSVPICLHRDDLLMGAGKYWKNKGFEVFQGAAINDTKALHRMCSLF